MPSDWDTASMMSLLFISGLSIFDQLVHKGANAISIPFFSERGSERGRGGKRRYHLPELNVQGAKLVALSISVLEEIRPMH